MLQTVTGLVDVATFSVVDGHGHVWIDPPDEAQLEIVLHDQKSITKELRKFREAGGQQLLIASPQVVGVMPINCAKSVRQVVYLLPPQQGFIRSNIILLIIGYGLLKLQTLPNFSLQN